MKKIYVMAAFLGASTFAFNQVVNETAVRKVDKTSHKAVKKVSPEGNQNKAPGNELWADDFDTTMTSEWVIDGDAASQGDWVIGDAEGQVNAATQAHNGFYQLLNSTTQDNGIAYFDGVQYLISGPVEAQNNWIEMANSVDLSSYDAVVFTFEQGYRAFNTDETFVEVSLNGGSTWEQEVDVNEDVLFGQYGKSVIREHFDVSQSSQVKFRFRWQCTDDDDDYGSGYAWQVDDVSITTLPDNDIDVRDYNYGATPTGAIWDFIDYVPYRQIPLSQVSDMGVTSMIISRGSAQQTNVKVTAEEPNESYNGESAGTTLDYAEADTIMTQTDFVPPALGDYMMNFEMIGDQADDVPGNNGIDSYKFTVGEYIYAMDTSTTVLDGDTDGSITSGTIADANSGEVVNVIEPGNWYEMFAQEDAIGIDFQFADSITVGAQVFGKIYSVDLAPDGTSIERNLVEQTLPYNIQAGDEAAYRELSFASPVTLDPGIYAVTVVCLDVSGFSVATSGEVKIPGTSFVHAPENTNQPWYGNSEVPIVRLHLDEGSSNVNEDELSKLNVTQFPNPFANETTVSFNLEEASNVSYTITDMTGKVISSVDEGNLTTGDHKITVDGASLANGVYYLNLKTDNAEVTRKMVVNK